MILCEKFGKSKVKCRLLKTTYLLSMKFLLIYNNCKYKSGRMNPLKYFICVICWLLTTAHFYCATSTLNKAPSSIKHLESKRKMET